MDSVYTPRLDALKQMQSRPLGTNTMLYRDPSTADVGRDYRRQQSDYNLARRLLRRDALRGDANAAINMIGLQDKAVADGVSYGGIQSGEARQAAVAGRIGERQRGIEFNELARKKAMETMGAPTTPTTPEDGSAKTNLGQLAMQNLDQMGGTTPRFRQGLDRAIGMAKTPEEMADLERVAGVAGIGQNAFARRKNWWETR